MYRSALVCGLCWCFLGCSNEEVVDNCETLVGSQCTRGCEPIFTSSESFNEPCAHDGVFFGCVPAADSEFWDRESSTTEFGVCDVEKGDTLGYLYCFEGRAALYWYYKNIELWCRGSCEWNPPEDCTGL